MMSVSVDVAIPNENKKNFSITPFETIKIHLLETILKLQKLRFFCPSKVLNPKPLAQKFYALPTEPDGSEIFC